VQHSLFLHEFIEIGVVLLDHALHDLESVRVEGILVEISLEDFPQQIEQLLVRGDFTPHLVVQDSVVDAQVQELEQFVQSADVFLLPLGLNELVSQRDHRGHLLLSGVPLFARGQELLLVLEWDLELGDHAQIFRIVAETLDDVRNVIDPLAVDLESSTFVFVLVFLVDHAVQLHVKHEYICRWILFGQ